ncbi:MAG: FkbM family methyltransferase [Chitinophagaceae bacterium]|nr:FkbM family methyltransferase [Chitinophagaceae bacterium]
MMKKFVKKIIPNSLLSLVQKTLIEIRRKRDLVDEENSLDFKRRKSFYEQFLKKGSTYFDIGANHGNRISPIIKLNVGLIVAVEPQEACCNYLKAKYKGITVLQNGVGEIEETKTFYLSSDSVLSSFSKDFIAKTSDTRFVGNTWDNTTQVHIITLDSLIEKYGLPDFVKVDVEGFELEVFKGLSKSLKVVSFEYTVPELNDVLLSIIDRLESLGCCKFNYSIGESMEFSLTEWITSKTFKSIVLSDDFITTGFGDVYTRFE